MRGSHENRVEELARQVILEDLATVNLDVQNLAVVVRERENRELLRLGARLHHAADAILLKLPSKPDENRSAQLEVVKCSHPGFF